MTTPNTLSQEDMKNFQDLALAPPAGCCGRGAQHGQVKEAGQKKVHKVDVLEAKQIVIRDDQGRKRISMGYIGGGSEITIHAMNGNAVAIFGMTDLGMEHGQDCCLPTPTFYLSARDEDENEVFCIQTEVQNGQILPALYVTRGKNPALPGRQDMARFPVEHLHAALGPGETIWKEEA
jgi:hypothetical protein